MSGYGPGQEVKGPKIQVKKMLKAAVCALAWILPVVGSAIILNILLEDTPHKPRPFIPLLDFIFLAAVLNQNASTSEESSGMDMHGSVDVGNGDSGDT